MSLKLMYITNKVEVAKIAQETGVDRIWIDLECMGKEERQHGMNTVKSNHSIDDIKKIKPIMFESELLVRVNPMHKASINEINKVIEYGADVVMLPMFKTKTEVEEFIKIVDGRAKVLLLLETKEAAENISEVLDVKGIDEVHIGLNDLHLAYNKRFMFELLIDGTVNRICEYLTTLDVEYGFGGIARVGYGMVPAEYIIGMHYQLGSTAAILSRSFCDANSVEDPTEIYDTFKEGINNIRLKEEEFSKYTNDEFSSNYDILKSKVEQVVAKM